MEATAQENGINYKGQPKPHVLKKLGIYFSDLNLKKDCGIYAAMRVFVGKSRETLFFPGFLSMDMERAGGKLN